VRIALFDDSRTISLGDGWCGEQAAYAAQCISARDSKKGDLRLARGRMKGCRADNGLAHWVRTYANKAAVICGRETSPKDQQ
jgi:hypothetical protein